MLKNKLLSEQFFQTMIFFMAAAFTDFTSRLPMLSWGLVDHLNSKY